MVNSGPRYDDVMPRSSPSSTESLDSNPFTRRQATISLPLFEIVQNDHLPFTQLKISIVNTDRRGSWPCLSCIMNYQRSMNVVAGPTVHFMIVASLHLCGSWTSFSGGATVCGAKIWFQAFVLTLA